MAAIASLPPPDGVYVPVPTFFKSSSSAGGKYAVPTLDIPTQQKHAVYLAKAGIRGIVAFGSTGESVHMHNKERKLVIAGIREAVDSAGFKDYPVIAGTSSQSIEEVVDQMAEAKTAGASWGMILAPGFTAARVKEEGIIQWFEAVADRSPIPIMIYHFPMVSNMLRLLPSAFVKLAKHPNIVGCKLSHPEVSQHIQIALHPQIDHEHFHVFTGYGQHLVPVMTMGASGTIDALACLFPRSMVRLYDLSKDDVITKEQAQERKKIQFLYASAADAIVGLFGTAGLKEGLTRLRGIGEKDGLSRAPLYGGLTEGDATWTKMQAVVEPLNKVELSL